MTTTAKFIFAAVYLWIGFVCAISFMEAWLKFRAPGLSLKAGLEVGRLVFHALNKVEWLLAVAIALGLCLSATSLIMPGNGFFYLPVLLLALQTIWLLPALDARVELYLKEVAVPPSSLHLYYIIMEVLKTGSLLLFSIRFFKPNI